MKRLGLLSLLCLLWAAMSSAQEEFTAGQLKLRSDIETFLKEEGYVPEIDSDGDIKFKKEGKIYYVQISKVDKSPMYVRMYKYYTYSESFTRAKIAKALESTNLNKGVKILCFDNSYYYQSEQYLNNAETFKFTFYKLLSQLEALQKEIAEICSD